MAVESPEALRKRLADVDALLQSSDMAAESAAQAQVVSPLKESSAYARTHFTLLLGPCHCAKGGGSLPEGSPRTRALSCAAARWGRDRLLTLADTGPRTLRHTRPHRGNHRRQHGVSVHRWTSNRFRRKIIYFCQHPPDYCASPAGSGMDRPQSVRRQGAPLHR